MLTKLEVDGFKNLLGFESYFGPYTCIAGLNAVGKSNIFDAIEFLSLLADHSFYDATKYLRAKGDLPADPRYLFWNNAQSDDPVIRLAAEMIVGPTVVDDFGREAHPTNTFLRYEVRLRYRAAEPGSGQPQLQLEHEHLHYIKTSDALKHLPWLRGRPDFRQQVVTGKRSAGYISTSIVNGEAVINVHQDGGSRGKPRPSPASRAPRTLVSTTTSTDDQTILAARREMQSWRMLALEPTEMRTPDDFYADPHVAPNGGHLPATLARIIREEGQEVTDMIAAELNELADVRAVDVDRDDKRDQLTLVAQLGDSPLLPARSLSDGTLRFLALCIARRDVNFQGLLCMEEPENGMHPTKIGVMAELVQSLAVDPRMAVGPENPLRQIMINTHSPLLVQCQDRNDVVVAVPTFVRRGVNMATTLRLAPLPTSWRAKAGIPPVSMGAIADFTEEPDTKLILEEVVDA